jgi:serine/threonine protein kinase
MAALREGDRIHNYLLEARVGAGSFGEVWRAKHHVFGDIVAIKIPTDPQYVRNLQREGVAIHGLRHPNIVRAIDMDPYADPPYLIMEYVDGPSLRNVIEDQRNRFPIPAVAAILRGVLNALAAAHQNGVIHRDLKPANILLGHPLDSIATITEQVVKVTDFGLGHIGGMTTQAMVQSGSMLSDDGGGISGTLAYMSPEQKEGAPLDARSDLYSCGIILFEMLTGERPQGTELPSSLRPDVPSYLDETVRRSYTRLDRRFASATEMLAALAPSSGPPPLRPKRTPPGVAPHCPACDQPVQREDQFCIQCGTQLVESVARCGACEAFVQRSDRFCIFCGKDLGILA